MNSDISNQNLEKALQLCDILGLDDIGTAIAIMEEVNWNLQQALNIMQKQTTASTQVPTVPTHYTHNDENDDSQTEEQDQNLFEYVYDRESRRKLNQDRFNEKFQGIKLSKTATEPPNKIGSRLSYDKNLVQNYSNHRHLYQLHLLEDSESFCRSILGEKNPKLSEVSISKVRNNNNRQFIVYLQKQYKSLINFTFGTFFLNLARSHLDQKPLLVYIHKKQFENSESVRMILSQPEISKFINKNFIAYGMFDNSDDYEIVQKYVVLKDLPAFAIFKFNPKQNKEQFLSHYSILQKTSLSFMQWLGKNAGIQLKKKSQIEIEELQKKKSEEKSKPYVPLYTHSQIMDQQNNQYLEMERIYKLKRVQSKLKKDQVLKIEKLLEEKRHKFENTIEPVEGKTIEIKFRLPYSGKSLARVFSIDSKVNELFDFIDCFGRNEFEDNFAQFDLAQTFPKLSLLDKKQSALNEVFPDSFHENIIVKQL